MEDNGLAPCTFADADFMVENLFVYVWFLIQLFFSRWWR